MRQKLRRLAFGCTVAVALFGAFTTFVPCKYSSLPSVKQRLGLVVYADVPPVVSGGKVQKAPGDCNCNHGWSGEPCAYIDSCYPSNSGCGPFWMLSCNGCLEGGSCFGWTLSKDKGNPVPKPNMSAAPIK